MNSHRDNVKDAIVEGLMDYHPKLDNCETACDIADGVFDALGITEDEQDGCGGYFMLHANKGEKPFVPPKTRDDDGCVIPERHVEAAEHEKRLEELQAGTSRYTFEEFRQYAKDKQSYPENHDDWYIFIITPVCRYGQSFTKLMSLKNAKKKFADFYYPMYLEDCERSDNIGKVDNDKI